MSYYARLGAGGQGRRSLVRGAASLSLGIATVLQCAFAAEPAQELSRLSLAELADVPVTSVSKSAELLSQASAAIYVITHDDIRRSGAKSISEALRLAPNLQVSQLSSSNYVVTARGFGGSPEAQNFSNKLLILIDGRSVYSPLYSGVYLDVQDTVMEDIERIEVISGPGATLWGANAMNGVINIITRSAYVTAGGLVSASGGNKEQNLAGRYGGTTDGGMAYRFYGKVFERGAMELLDGSSAEDGWFKIQGGFRTDWARAADALTVQGDLYRGTQDQLGLKDQTILGGNTLVKWQRTGEKSDFHLQAYVDQTQRAAPQGGVAFVLHTYDLEFQQSVATGADNRIIWGAGGRINSYGITNSQSLLFLPAERDLTLLNLFAQDVVSLDPVKLTFGVKLEKDPYSGWEFLPDARISWDVTGNSMLWAAGSRAIRSPTPFDVDVVERIGAVDFLTGLADFQPEEVVAYEVGYRGQPSERFSLSVSAFYNQYDELRTIEPSPPVFLPLRWGNLMEGNTYGIEAWANWQVASWWRLSPGVRTLKKDLEFKPGASGLLGLGQAGNDPEVQALLASSVDIGSTMTLDASLRYNGELPEPALDDYLELNARFGWRISRSLELSVTGENLLHSAHRESASAGAEYIVRSAYLQANWIW